VLALVNVVLSGFIVMLWGVPRWDVGRAAASPGEAGDRAKNAGGASSGGASAAGAAGKVGATPASASGATASTAAAARLPAGAGASAGVFPGGPRRRSTPPAARAEDDADAGSAVEIPELPQAILAVMPGQRAPDVTVPPPPPAPRQPAPAEVTDAGAAAATLKAGADDAIAAGNVAARATGRSAAPRIPVAGVDGVTMPERLAESHVRPTIAALADGEPVTGEVRLAATIRVDGSVAEVQVLSSSRTGAGLEQAAADAVRRWRYKPATRDGQPIDSRLTITVTFR
jgi:protein TonB